ncbi:MAG: hypothetical protein BWX70_01997 [Verrucomicrobia bacterium ADurb.Bin070]|nr:MAG: hypothetical protein BWX70_01997 [Verrucomicrobia bacterium ADurb.Bin070]
MVAFGPLERVLGRDQYDLRGRGVRCRIAQQEACRGGGCVENLESRVHEPFCRRLGLHGTHGEKIDKNEED